MDNVGERLLRSRINAVRSYKHKMCRTAVGNSEDDAKAQQPGRVIELYVELQRICGEVRRAFGFQLREVFARPLDFDSGC